jgi:hypothetical protein
MWICLVRSDVSGGNAGSYQRKGTVGGAFTAPGVADDALGWADLRLESSRLSGFSDGVVAVAVRPCGPPGARALGVRFVQATSAAPAIGRLAASAEAWARNARRDVDWSTMSERWGVGVGIGRYG